MTVALEICAARRQPIQNEAQVREGMLLVGAIVRQVQASAGRVLSYDDMVSLGNEGLVDAMIRFEPARGVEFKAYASQRIRGAILDGMRREGHMPRRAWGRACESLEFDEDLHSLDAGESPEETATRSQEAEAVLEAMEELAPEHAELVRRFYLEGERLQDISEELGYARGWGSRVMPTVHDMIRRRLNPHQAKQERRTRPCDGAPVSPIEPKTGPVPATDTTQTEITPSHHGLDRLQYVRSLPKPVFSGPSQGKSRLEAISAGPCQGKSRLEAISAGPCQGKSRLEAISAGPCQGKSRLEAISAGPCQDKSRLEAISAGGCQGESRLEAISAGGCQGKSRLEAISAGGCQGNSRPEAISGVPCQGNSRPEAISAGPSQGNSLPDAIRAGGCQGNSPPEAISAGGCQGNSLPDAMRAGRRQRLLRREAVRARNHRTRGQWCLPERGSTLPECHSHAIRRPLRPIGPVSDHHAMPFTIQCMRSVMNSPELVNKILASRNLPASALDQVLPEIHAIRPAKVRTLNAQVSKIVSRVLAVAPAVLAMREEIEKQTPLVPIASLEKLELYAYALQEAHLRCIAAGKPPDQLRALSEEAESVRRALRRDCSALTSRGLIDPKRLSACQGQPGYKTIATDLGILTSVMTSHWPAIEGKTGVTMAELGRARAIAEALLASVGAREMSARERAAASDVRDRVFTLLVQNYQLARRVVTFLRFDQGDAEKIAPSLFGGRHRRTRTVAEAGDKTSAVPEKAASSVDAAPAVNAPSPPTAVNAPSSPTAINAPVGSPKSNPFMH